MYSWVDGCTRCGHVAKFGHDAASDDPDLGTVVAGKRE